MLKNISRYWTHVTIILILALFAGSFLVPVWANTMALTAITLSLSMATFPVVQKHIRLNRSGAASKFRLARNIVLEFIGILLAMLLAGLIGRYAAGILTRQMGDELMKLIAGILIGMLTGLAVGILVRRVWGQLVRISSHA